MKIKEIGNIYEKAEKHHSAAGRVYAVDGISPTIRTPTGGGTIPMIIVPVLTPDRENKRQNGRRFKEDGEPAFTLTSEDRHGIMIDIKKSDKAVWSDKYQCYVAIRRLTPRECFRLQGWSDDYFEKAALVNSDSQLYKQAGNGVTVNVIQAIAERFNNV